MHRTSNCSSSSINGYNVPFSSVPAVFVGEWGLTNFENIELHLDDIVVQVAQNPNSTAPMPSETIPPVQLPDISGTNQLMIPLIMVAGIMAESIPVRL